MSTRIPRSGRRPYGKLYGSFLNKRFRSIFALGLAALIFASPLGGLVVSAREKGSAGVKLAANAGNAVVHNHEGGEAAHSQGDGVDGFVIRMIDGVATCGEVTPSEESLLPNQDATGVPVKDVAPIMLPGEKAHAQEGEQVNVPLTINLIALSQLQNDPNRAQIEAAFQKAASYWTSRIKSPTTVTVNIDYGPNVAGSSTPFPSGVLGSTSQERTLIDYPGFLTNLKASANGQAAKLNIYNALPTSFVPTDTGNGAVISVSRTLARNLGIPVATSPAADARIGFNSNLNGQPTQYDFDPDDGITAGQTDFVAVAAHEIGHALGFTSNAGLPSYAANVSAWDVFRFRTGTTAGTFSPANRIMSIGGGLQFYYTGQSFQNYTVPNSGTNTAVPTGSNVSELGLSNGGPSAANTNGGDSRQSSHWKADEQSGLFVGIMDPTISSGRKLIPTENDFSTLETIGWDLTGNGVIPPAPPAPPAPSNDNFTNAPTLNGCSGTTVGTNVGATKETGAGEPNNPASTTASRSVWYKWTAPSTGSVTVDTRKSGFDTILAAYSITGSGFSGLTLLDSDDDTDDPNTTDENERSSVISFNAAQGSTYYISVNGFDNNSGGDFGTFKLNWAQTGCGTGGGGNPTVGFNATTGQFFENDPLGYIAISVSRTDTSAAASVDYATNDASALTPCQTNTNGNASDRCDYATAVGTLRFVAGEQTKTIQIPLINDIYVEPAQTFTLTLKNPQGMTITGPTAINLTIVDDDTAGANQTNPIGGTEFFIREQYIDFLGRVADQGGFNFWLGRMTIPANCVGQAEPCDRIDTAKRFFESDEFKERGFYIFKLYDGVLGRAPQYSEFVPDVARLNGFQTVAEQRLSKDAYLADLINKTEFRGLYGNHVNADGTLVPGQATAFVDALITRAQVTLPAATRQTLINNLQSGARTPALTMEDFILTPEVNGVGTRIYDRAIITMQYFGFLRRSPDAGGFDFWWNRLANPNSPFYHNYREIVGNFITSDEYWFRFAFSSATP